MEDDNDKGNEEEEHGKDNHKERSAFVEWISRLFLQLSQMKPCPLKYTFAIAVVSLMAGLLAGGGLRTLLAVNGKKYHERQEALEYVNWLAVASLGGTVPPGSRTNASGTSRRESSSAGTRRTSPRRNRGKTVKVGLWLDHRPTGTEPPVKTSSDGGVHGGGHERRIGTRGLGSCPGRGHTSRRRRLFQHRPGQEEEEASRDVLQKDFSQKTLEDTRGGPSRCTPSAHTQATARRSRSQPHGAE